MAVQFAQFTDPQKTTIAISTVNDLPNGKHTLSFPDGTVVSVQPDLSIEERPAGADGPFEQCDIDGQVATYWYVWNGQTVGPYSVAFFRVTRASA